MSRPRVLMLDEPSMGLAPVIVAELFEKILEINRLGVTILLVEQNARLAMRVSDYTYVIDQGSIKIHGPSAEVREDPNVIKTYLGKFAKSKF
jgi:branched-chain amino acid transport system ATP-binding protein